jgi:hypothetical protein
MEKREQYGGDVSLSGGTVQIDDFKPMIVDMRAAYELDGGDVHLTHIDLTMDGFTSQLTGEVDLLNWPEQTYRTLRLQVTRLLLVRGIFLTAGVTLRELLRVKMRRLTIWAFRL